jgi:hypothetical protein
MDMVNLGMESLLNTFVREQRAATETMLLIG